MAQGQPLTDHRMGGSQFAKLLQADLSFNVFIGGTVSNQIQWFLANPFTGSLFHPVFNQTSFSDYKQSGSS
jgi:hypothetical protein